MLIAACVWPAAIAMEDRDTELMKAVCKSKGKRVEKLLDLGIHPDEVLEISLWGRERTLLMAAIDNKNKRMVELLLKRGASPNKPVWCVRTELGLVDRLVTPLSHAVEIGALNIVQLLVTHGAHIDARDNRNATALHLASTGGSLQMVELLLRKGADPLCKMRSWHQGATIHGDTPLMWAARAGKKECVLSLLTSVSEREEQEMRDRVMQLLLCINRMRVVTNRDEPWRVVCQESASDELPDNRLKQMRKLIVSKLMDTLVQDRLDRAEHMINLKNSNNQSAIDCALAGNHQDIACMLDMDNPESQSELCKIIKAKIVCTLRTQDAE